MTKYSGNITNLLQGVSQQPERARRPEQLTSQSNCMAFITKGLGKRPGSYLIKDLGLLTQFSNNAVYHYNRGDTNEAYVFSVGNGTLKVWDLFTGTEKTVTTPDGVGYLGASDPETAFKFHTVADTTFICNKEKIVTSGNATDDTGDFNAMIYCKQAHFGKGYKIKVNNNTIASYTSPSTVTLSVTATDQEMDKRTNLDTVAIMANLHSGLSTWASSNGVTYARAGDVVYLYKANASYNITIEDGNNGNDLKYVQSSINNYSNLPTTARHGFKVKVTGVDQSGSNDYYVEFNADKGGGTGTGVWEECAGFGVDQDLTASTMPHKIVRNSDGTFTLSEIDWVSRSAGDDDSNPLPSFVGSSISDIITYQGRFVATTEENQCGSVTFDFFNFFATSVIQESEDDPIDTASSDTQVTNLHHTIIFNSALVSFSDSAQFFHPGDTAFTSKTFSLASKAKYPVDIRAKPVAAAQSIFLPFRYEAHSGVRELFFDSLTGNFQAEAITDHVRKYIGGSITSMAATAGHNKLFVRSDADLSKLYIYEWYSREGPKLQSAWSTWEFNGDVIFMGLVQNTLYIITDISGNAVLQSIDISDQDSEGIFYPLRLDNKELVSGVIGADYWTIPTTVPGNIVVVAGEGTEIEGLILTYYEEAGEIRVSEDVLVTRYINTYITPVYVEDNYAETLTPKFWVGIPYTSKGVLTNPYIRDAEGNPITSDKLRLNFVKFNLSDTGHITLSRIKGNQVFKKTYDARVIDKIGLSLRTTPDLQNTEVQLGVRSDRDKCTIGFSSESHLPFYILDIDWTGDFRGTGRRN